MLNRRVSLFGLAFVAAERDRVVDEVLERVRAGEQTLVLTVNVDFAVRFLQQSGDERFQAACRAAEVVVADGMPIVWASRLMGRPLPCRVTGVDLMVDLCKAAAENDLSVSFLGAPPGVAERAAALLRTQLPRLRVAGVHAPPLGFETITSEMEKALEAANAGQPDFLFVAFGSPKAEVWVHRVRTRLRARAVMGVGGALDMLAGRVPRAPGWMQGAGVEWAWRLWQEPTRLWRRYLTDGIMFPLYVWKEWRQPTKRTDDRSSAS